MRALGRYKSLAANMALFAVNAVSTRLISFFLVPLYTYYMSAGEYGITDMSLTVISLVTPIVTLSAGEAVLRFVIGDRNHDAEYTAIALGIVALSIPVVAALTPVLNLGFFGGLGEYKGWFVLAYASSGLMNICGEIARGLNKVKLIPVCASISSLVTLISAALLIGGVGMGIKGYFVSVSFGPLIASALYLIIGRIAKKAIEGMRRIATDPSSSLLSLFPRMLRYSLPLIPNAVFWWLSSGINRFFITGMIDITASGMFAAASKIPGLINTAYSIFQSAWQLSAFQESREKDLGSFFSTIFTVVQASMTILCASLSFFAPWLSSFLLQGETYDAWSMVPTLLLANLLNVLSTFYGTVYTTTMHTSYIMRTTMCGAITCVALTPLLIPILGTYGACVASVVAQAIVLVLRAIDSRKHIEFDAGWGFLIPTMALLVTQAVTAQLQPSFWQAISGGCLCFVIVIQGVRLYLIATKMMK